jgi:HK97 family phage major capsid protein
MPSPTHDFLRRLELHREQIRSSAEELCLEARAQGRSELNDGERARLAHMTADLRALGQRAAEYRSEVSRAAIPDALARIGSPAPEKKATAMLESTVYRRDASGPSWMRDLIRTSLNRDETGESRQRLGRHADDVANSGDFESRDLSRVDGSGGYAVPPAWLMNQYIELARPGRAFANLCQRQPLPGGTDSINIPKILSGTVVGVQTADNQAVADIDLTDTFVNAPVRTISGQQGVAIQLIDQSPIAFDDVIFRDLVAAHAAQTDQQCLYGTGTGGQVLGVANTAGIQTVPVGALTIQSIYSALANAINLIHTNRFLPPEVIVMHPRRWSWLLTLLDQQNRPLFVPDANGPYIAAGVLTDVDSQQVVGRTHGLPIVTDPNITTTDGGTGTGTGGTDDVIYVLRASDLVLWESGIRARVLPETKASNLTVLIQIYSYFAFAASRYPQSVVQLTGLNPPSF